MQEFSRLFAAAACALLVQVAALTPAAAADAERRAFVVSNHHYQHLEKLETATNDGHRIACFLRGTPLADCTADDSDRRVVHLRDATSAAFWKKWAEFLDDIEKFQAGGVAVFYFSGHGTEIDYDSFLLPVDILDRAAEAEALVLRDPISVRRLFREFSERQSRHKKKTGYTVHGVFVIDACRSGDPPRKTVKSANLSKPGSAPIVPPPGMIVLYAASAGQVAHTHIDDAVAGAAPGADQRLSVYTKYLVRLLEDKRDYSLQTIAQKVKWDVHVAVAAKKRDLPQTPAYFDDLARPITIRGVEKSSHDKDEARDGDDDAALRAPRAPDWDCPTCPQLVIVPSGAYRIGSPRDETGRDANEDSELAGADGDPRMTVTIPRPFAIGKSEVTRGQFRAYLTRDKKECPAAHEACALGGSEKPVTNITWHEAQGYVAWLNRYLSLGDPANPRLGYYRLPTEAEWEYAARGGTTGRFVSGEDERKLCQYGNGADLSLNSLYEVNKACSDGKGRDVASTQSYKPNAFGLYDVHGNAWEWVADCWTDKHMPEKSDGRMSGTLTDPSCRRVARGGSWRSAPAALRLAKRVAFASDHARPTLGFRVVRVLPAP